MCRFAPGSQVVTTPGSWQSSNAAVATVDASGIVTGVSAGTSDISVTVDGVTATIAVTVSAFATNAETFSGAVALAGNKTGTLALSLGSAPRVTGTFYSAAGVFTLAGRIDSPTNIVNVTGGGFTLLGTLSGAVLTGTLTDSAGSSGAFSAIDSSHEAVTPLCGAYTTDGVSTSSESAESGAFVLALAIDGTAAGASVSADAAAAPLTFVGHRDGNSLTLTTNLASTLTGEISNDSATGPYQAPTGRPARFTATTRACR